MFPLSTILPRAAAFHPERLAVIDGDTRLSYAELAARSHRLAGALLARGLRPGERVAILDDNSHRYLEAYYACAAAGLVLVPLNTRLAAPEIAAIMDDCGAAALIATERFFEHAEHARAAGGPLEHLICHGPGTLPPGADAYEAAVAGAEALERPFTQRPDDLVQIYYTSGTTGAPKGVCLTNRNMVASAFDALLGLGLLRGDTWLHAAPMFHLVDAWAVWAMPLIGARQAALAFRPDTWIETVARLSVTASALPPTLIDMVIGQPAATSANLASLRVLLYGGSPMPFDLLKRVCVALPDCLLHSYGITETSGIVTVLPPEAHILDGTPDEIARSRSAGQAVPNLDVGVVDDDGALVDPGTVGEVVISGPRVMQGYWNKPQQTREAIHSGWYHTGDLGTLDAQGYLTIVDRKKDMIVSGGENVYSVEVETALMAHPAVRQAAVIGVPDGRWGEAVMAIVACDPRALSQGALDEDALIAHCRDRIAGYKVPKSVDLRADDLPVSGAGKIAKAALRAPFWKDHERKI
jgi:long-chain acyl-CoA synthetase